MSAQQPKGKRIYCNFCGKTDIEVELMVSGPDVVICNECIDACSEIRHERSNMVRSYLADMGISI